jgi:hypothetical protein
MDALREALDRLFMDKRQFLLDFSHDPLAAIDRFNSNPASFGPLRSYVGEISLKANITRVRRLLQKLQRQS